MSDKIERHIELRGHSEFPCPYCGFVKEGGWRVLLIERCTGIDEAGDPYDSTSYFELPNCASGTRFKDEHIAERVADNWAERLNCEIKNFILPGEEEEK